MPVSNVRRTARAFSSWLALLTSLVACNAILGIEQGEREPDAQGGSGNATGGRSNATGGRGGSGGTVSAGEAGDGTGGEIAEGGSGMEAGRGAGGGSGGGTQGGTGGRAAETSGGRSAEGGAPTTDGGEGGATGSGGAGGEGGSGGAAPSTCTPKSVGCIDAKSLGTCNASGDGYESPTTCSAGCVAGSAAHCKLIRPSGVVTQNDLKAKDVSAKTLPSGEIRIYTDTGQIAGAFVRAGNEDFTAREVINGVSFVQTDGVGVFGFGALTIAQGAVIKVIGSAPIAIVSTADITLAGIIDARPMDSTGALCPVGVNVAGPGGFLGGTAGKSGPTPISGGKGGGPGGGSPGTRAQQGNPSAGGGAGGSAVGGKGAPGSFTGSMIAGGVGGPALSAPATWTGGSGGGGGGDALGGGGGGAVQIVAAGSIVIGNGADVQGINVGGCGGQGGLGSGGGGAGGTIVLEAAVVRLSPLGTLAANGGGGGNIDNSTSPVTRYSGAAGTLDALPALGGLTVLASAPDAGNGGAGTAPAGGGGNRAMSGGGGATGFIRIATASGMVTVANIAVFSPARTVSGVTITTLVAD